MSKPKPFWLEKPMSALTQAEWESLCDGCGRCCLIKMEEEDTGTYYYTDVACRLFDREGCSCRSYETRDAEVEDCVRLTPENAGALAWMPPSCAYRLVAEGRDLPAWHPLVSGDRASVERAGASVRGRVHALEDEVTLTELVQRIRQWPGRWPRRPPQQKSKK